MNRPVLLIHFNRPSATRRQLEALKEVAPERVWILCDGPRKNKPSDIEKVCEVRELLDHLPWQCEVKKLYRKENLGCFKNISAGISWFLNDCGAGMILEDDIIPDPSFFQFCDELLDRYADEPRVYAVSGQHSSPVPMQIDADYGFCNYFDCWGWATWKRAWEQFDPDMTAWRDRAEWGIVSRRVLHNLRARLYWDVMFRMVDVGRRDSWAYRYLLTIWKQQGCTVVPKMNLARNVGFDDKASHTGHLLGREAKTHVQTFPLSHPTEIVPDPLIDQWYEDELCSKSPKARLRWLYHKFKRRYDRLVTRCVS